MDAGGGWPALQQLQRFAGRGPRRSGELCELCGAGIAAEHGHVANTESRAILCVCRPCHMVLTHEGAGGGRLRAVPTRYVMLPGLAAAGPAWEALQLPVGLAFVLRSSGARRVAALYPSPAGATESELPLHAWDDLVRAVPALESLAADVEALLVRRREARGEAPAALDALIAPIDACYELAGRIRRLWRGFQGGDEVWQHVDEFFEQARRRAQETAAS